MASEFFYFIFTIFIRLKKKDKSQNANEKHDKTIIFLNKWN